MGINTALDTGNQMQADNTLCPNPDWITEISLTFDPDNDDSTNNSVTKTKSDFRKINWDLSGGAGSFNIKNNFVGQFTSFGFNKDGDDTFSTGGMVQQYTAGGAGNEFPLNSTATTPGGLPFLGLAALLFYYKKMKKLFKL